MKKIVIFDLDATVLDSSERVTPCILPNGDLDLNKYRAQACTREQVYTDKLLPLARTMQNYIANGYNVAICTARHMYKHDYDFLKKHGLKCNLILSRDSLSRYFNAQQIRKIYSYSDAKYKGVYFDLLVKKYPDHELVIYDDHLGVLAEASKKGIKALNANRINKRVYNFPI